MDRNGYAFPFSLFIGFVTTGITGNLISHIRSRDPWHDAEMKTNTIAFETYDRLLFWMSAYEISIESTSISAIAIFDEFLFLFS